MSKKTLLYQALMLGALLHDDVFTTRKYREIPDEQRPGKKQHIPELHRELKEFTVKGHKIMAYSRKDAISRLKYKKLI